MGVEERGVPWGMGGELRDVCDINLDERSIMESLDDGWLSPIRSLNASG